LHINQIKVQKLTELATLSSLQKFKCDCNTGKWIFNRSTQLYRAYRNIGLRQTYWIKM